MKLVIVAELNNGTRQPVEVWVRDRDRVHDVAQFVTEELGAAPCRFLVFDGTGVMVEDTLTIGELAPRDGEHLVLEAIT